MAAMSDSQAKSSSPCSCSLKFSALSPIQTSSGASKKSMEDVWGEITLSSIDHPPSNSGANISVSATNFGLAFQDSSVQEFLSRPPPKGKQRTRACHSSADQGGGRRPRPVKESNSGFFACETSRVPPILGLDTEMMIHYVEGSGDPSSAEPQLHTTRESHGAFGLAAESFSFQRLDPLNYSSPVEFSILCNKKRIPDRDDSTGDHRNKRQMKNRESAARSRARKRAYTNELELKVSRLAEENCRLRRQLEKHCTAATSVQFPKKHALQRTLTAPF